VNIHTLVFAAKHVKHVAAAGHGCRHQTRPGENRRADTILRKTSWQLLRLPGGKLQNLSDKPRFEQSESTSRFGGPQAIRVPALGVNIGRVN
jgi:hypothetical protein